MLQTRHFLGLITLAIHCTLFSADSPHFFGWEELFETLLKQSCLQPHLTHQSAYPLIRVNKKFTELMDKYRDKRRTIVWHIKSPEYNICEMPLSNNNIRIQRLSITHDASCNIAYGISKNTGVLLLCKFSWPSRNLIDQKVLSGSFVKEMVNYETFFWGGIGFVGYFQNDKFGSVAYYQNHVSAIVGYLPTGFMFRINHYNQSNIERIIFFQKSNYTSQRSGMGCTIDYVGGRTPLFSTDTSAIVKEDSGGTIIPWQKIAWDDKT